jgi:hypothetical protein
MGEANSVTAWPGDNSSMRSGNAGLSGLGPRVEESGIGLIAGYAWSGPYEDVKLKGK